MKRAGPASDQLLQAAAMNETLTTVIRGGRDHLRRVTQCRWLLDAPVSNSGRLKTEIRALAKERALDWTVEVTPDPDALLESVPPDVLVASADSRILDQAPHSWQLARETVEHLESECWILDLRGRSSATA